MPNLPSLGLAGNKLSGEIPSTFYSIYGTVQTLGIRYNALYTSNPNLKSLLDRQDRFWSETQTVAPSRISAVVFSSSSVLVSWEPIADLAITSESNPLYLPQLADGAGYSTTVVLLNTSSTLETGVLHLFANDGSPLTVREVNGSFASSFNYSTPPGGVFVLQTDASSQTLQTG